MKTQIIQLEAHEDIITAREKIGWGQTGRIILVWPSQNGILYRRLDLIILQRHSYQLGAQLALVTQDPEVRYHANQLGIPTFKNLRQAQSNRWRGIRRRRLRLLGRKKRPDFQSLRAEIHPAPVEKLGKPLPRFLFFGFSMLALLAIAAAFLPEAEIFLEPKSQFQEITLPVTASPSYEATNLAGYLPAHWSIIVVESRGTITTTGSILVPENPATGEAQFTNLTEERITIPKDTIVTTLGPDVLRFATTTERTVLAGPGRSVFVPVQALTLGSSSNLAAHTILAIEGSLGLKLSVTNPTSTRNGTDRSAPGPTPSDQIRLYNQLLNSLRQTALADFDTRLPSSSSLSPQVVDVAIQDSLRLSRILEKTYTPAGIQAADRLNLVLRLEFQMLTVAEEDLLALTLPILDAGLPVGYSPVSGTLEIEHDTAPIFDSSETSARWRIQARRLIRANISPEQAVSLALGRHPDQAASRIAAALPLEIPPLIRLSPVWWPYLPVVPFRITVSEN